jgi:hypothetical protein
MIRRFYPENKKVTGGFKILLYKTRKNITTLGSLYKSMRLFLRRKKIATNKDGQISLR